MPEAAYRFWVPVGVAMFFCMPGCGERRPALGQVDGVVELDGKVLPNVLVHFLPEPTPENQSAPDSEAVTDTAGRYRLQCGRFQSDGAVVGPHRVVLLDREVRPRGDGKPTPARFPVRYSQPNTTPLRYTVNPGTQSIPLVLPAK